MDSRFCESERIFDDMVPFDETVKSVVLGTDDAGAKPTERPGMEVVLDYAFQMGRHETTCGEFVTVMKSSSPEGSFASSLVCGNDSLPLVDVTYFDAVLYANARSKVEHVDTVYDYIQVVMDGDGHCTNLSGLAYHPERKGFRLPTEAEWSYVAGLEWNPLKGWNNANSGYRLHPVCSYPSDSYFCDFAGNVMEWVNDWRGDFRDTTISNFVGAPDGGGLGERIVKGGCFNLGAESTKFYSRGDVYTVTSSTRAEYVGFRLAYGSIPQPVWMGNDGIVKNSVVVPLASAFDLFPHTSSYKAKLAFRNDVSGNLSYIDYSNTVPAVVEIYDTVEVYHPEISPDGRYVAFCTKPEGVSGKSELFVRLLDAGESKLMKLDVESAAIPRWLVNESGDTSIVYVSDAGNNKDESTWKSYSTWRVPFENNAFGMPEKLFDGSFHGGVSKNYDFAVTGSRLLRARSSRNGEVTYSIGFDEEQACNVSLARDSSNRVLFLDFGGKIGLPVVGRRYEAHQYVFIANSGADIEKALPAPAGFTFDHTEWTVGKFLNGAVATLSNADGMHERVVLIDFQSNEVVNLVKG